MGSPTPIITPLTCILGLLLITTAAAAFTTAASDGLGATTPNSTRFTGLVAAVFSPFDADKALKLGAVPEQADVLVKTGVKTAFVCGTTGESLSLTIAERKVLAEEWMKVGKAKGLRVIIHVGHESVEDAVDLAAHAQSLGADAVAAMPPVFFKPSTTQLLFETMRTIAEGAPKLPFFYYHIPEMTGSDPDMIEFIGLMATVPNFQGIKFTSMDIMTYQRLINYQGGAYDILYGKDQMLLEALDVGSKGAVGSTYNFAGEHYNWVIGNFTLGTAEGLEKAKETQEWAVELIAWLLAHDLAPAQKAAMNLIQGHDLVGEPRLPIGNLTAETEGELKAFLHHLGLL